MAVAFRSLSQYSVYNPGGIGQTGFVKPAGVAADDILIGSFVLNATSDPTVTGWTNPAGWTTLWDQHVTAGGTNFHWIVAWKRAGGSEPSSYVWDFTASATYTDAICLAYSGANTTTAIDASGVGSPTTTTTHTAPSLTATYANDFHVVLACEDHYGSWTPPAGYTERFDDSGFGSTAADKALTASGATGTVAFTSSAAGGGLAGAILLIDATPTGGGPSFQPAWAAGANQVIL